MVPGFNTRSMLIVAFESMKSALRTGGGIVTLVLMMMVGLISAWALAVPFESPGTELQDAGTAEERIARYAEIPWVRDQFSSITGSDEEQADYLLTTQPALMSGILVILLGFFPFIACSGSFNQTSGDIGSKGLRYLLLRTSRSNVFFGRFLGVLLFGALGLFLLLFVLCVYMQLQLQAYPTGAMVSWCAQGFVALFFITLPHMAFCSFISSRVDSPFGSLAMCSLLVSVPLLFVLLAINQLEHLGDLSWLWRTMPWGWKYELLHGDFMIRLRAFGAMIGFAAFFLWLGNRSFNKRDL